MNGRRPRQSVSAAAVARARRKRSCAGDSGGIDAGSKLTPWIKYNGQGAFKGGKANIRIKADGTFTWTRLIKKSKGLTGYVSWQDVKSNEVYWPKVR